MTETSMTAKVAQDAGMDFNQLNRLKEAIKADIRREEYDGAVIMIGRSGKPVLCEAMGYSDLDANRKAKLDDVWFIFSFAKTMAAAMIFSLIDRGKLTLTTPVVEIIPEFGTRGKQRVNIYHLLTHTAGMSNDMPPIPIEQWGNLEAFVAGVCEQKILGSPGGSVQYSSYAATAILGEIIRRLDDKNRPFKQIVADELFQPLKMFNTAYGLRKDLADRVVPVKYRDRTKGLLEPEMVEGSGLIITEDAEIPSAGAFSTVGDIFRWAEMWRRGGELDGVRVLSPSIVELATRNHTGDLPNDLYDYAREMFGWPSFPAYMGMHFFLRGEGIHPTPFGITASPETYGSICLGSGVFWVDPKRDVTFVCLTSGLLEEAASTQRLQRLSDMAIAAAVPA